MKTQGGEADLDWKLQRTNSQTHHTAQYCRATTTQYIQTSSLQTFY